MRFRSRIDPWLVLLVLATGLLALTTSIPLIVAGAPAAIPIAAVVFVSVVGIPVWLLATTDYNFEGSDLCIRSGPFRWRIPARSITAVTPCRSFISSPALSMERLRIYYGRRESIEVSPHDRTAFLTELNARRSENKVKPTHNSCC